MKHNYNNNKRSNGYTLIELIVGIIILSILTIITVKGLSGARANLELNREAHQLEATIKNCQSKAMYTGNYYKIEFQPTLNRYKVFNKSDLESIKYLGNIKLHYTNFTNNKVYFYKTGVPNMGGTVTLKTKNNKTLYVIMTPVTARTRISDIPPENW